MATTHTAKVKAYNGTKVTVRATGYPKDSVAGSFVSLRIEAGVEISLMMGSDDARAIAAILEEAAAEAGMRSGAPARAMVATDLDDSRVVFVGGRHPTTITLKPGAVLHPGYTAEQIVTGEVPS